MTRLPAASELFDAHDPVWMLAPSDDGAVREVTADQHSGARAQVVGVGVIERACKAVRSAFTSCACACAADAPSANERTAGRHERTSRGWRPLHYARTFLVRLASLCLLVAISAGCRPVDTWTRIELAIDGEGELLHVTVDLTSGAIERETIGW